MGILRKFLERGGLKRRIVSALALVIDIVTQVPGLEGVAAALQQVNGALGGAAIVHGGAKGDLSQEKLAGAISATYLLIALSYVFPVLLPIQPGLLKAAGVLAAVRLGTKVVPSEGGAA